MKFQEFLSSFTVLVESCPSEPLGAEARYVFLSDLHMGDGGRRDDLVHNRVLVQAALRDWYLDRGYVLVLNGDIEDLSKFRLRDIRIAWCGLYALFDEFGSRGKLRKIIGNHDLALLRERDYPYDLLHGLSLVRGAKRIFAFHGHQASRFFVRYDYLSDFIVRYLAKPLRIRNSSVSDDSRHRFKAERRIYRASRRLGIVTVSGHTHRPLFESLSKYDSLRWSIEDLLREYPLADHERKTDIAQLVEIYGAELERLGKKELRYGLTRGLYEEKSLLIPCLFNSGCATGKHGLTAIEISNGSIELVHWSAGAASREYIGRESLAKDTMPGSGIDRYVLRRDGLDQVFARIELLARRS